MELIRIGEGKLKVMLTEEDMALYALDDTASDCSGTETRRAVFAILDAAKAQIGFDAARDRVCIQMFRGRAGGCELFVSCTEKGARPAACSTPSRARPGWRRLAACSPRRASRVHPPPTSATTAGCSSRWKRRGGICAPIRLTCLPSTVRRCRAAPPFSANTQS